MTIKTENGSYDVTGSGQGIYNSIAGSLGLASFLGLGTNGGGLLGMGGGNSQYVNKDELKMSISMANKDAEIALLKSNAETDKKLSDVFKAAADRDVIFRDRLESQYRDLAKAITDEREARMRAEGAQSVLNSQYQSAIDILGTQQRTMAQTLADITTSVIPSRKVCDTGCCGCNA